LPLLLLLRRYDNPTHIFTGGDNNTENASIDLLSENRVKF
ncbi:uncharacterized, partial [Tachysurus ichikawai]